MHESTLGTLILLCAMGFFGALTPGPDMLLILKTTLRYGAWQGFRVLFGIASGWCVFLGLIYAGLSHWLSHPYAQLALSLIGGVYLLSMAYGMLSHGASELRLDSEQARSGYLQGLIINLSNPKAILFFVFLVTPFIDEGVGVSLIALWCALFSAFCLVIGLASFARSFIQPRFFQRIDRICGVLFACFGWLLCFECGGLLASF